MTIFMSENNSNDFSDFRLGETGGGVSPPIDFQLDNIEELLDFSSSTPEEHSPLLGPYNYAPSTGVPMEIQENARLPTFNLTVDRSNSSHSRQGQPWSPTTRKELDELVRLSENDVSLTEVFLKSKDRTSINKNYSAKGSMPTAVGEKLTAVKNGTDKKQQENDTNAAGAATITKNTSGTTPTTAETTANPMQQEQTQTSTPVVIAAPASLPLQAVPEAAPATDGQLAAHPYNFMAYGRPYQLPIPNAAGASSIPADVAMIGARAANPPVAPETPPSATVVPPTVYDVNTSQPSSSTATTTQAPPPPPQLPTMAAPTAVHAPSPANANAFAYTQAQAPPPPPSPAGVYAQPGSGGAFYRPSPHHGVARSTPTASITEATRRRAQFGFGANHVVPSVPLPPQSSSTSTTTTSGTKRSRSKKSTTQEQPHAPAAQQTTSKTVPAPSLPPSANSGAAYERKKQRAKDARVKLNESIERLSIAINLAGSQSKQRKTQGKDLDSRTINSMRECVSTAEAAKKWDRPSFVGSAATLIQGLNAQCEALMRELVKAQKQNERTTLTNGESTVSVVSNCDSETADYESPNKRQKIAVTPSDPMAFVFSCPKTLNCIASFLDPRSLLRCNKLSRSIRETRAFNNDNIWLNLAVQRFGAPQVRQWQERMEDDDDDDADGQEMTENQSTSTLTIYRQMDSANERPHMMDDGTVFLGEARMPHKVSCWVSMIERSNGETSRSVQRPPPAAVTNSQYSPSGSERPGTYTSLPVVELRFLIQNTGSHYPIGIKDQLVAVDASTRRRGDEWNEITWDVRFQKHFRKEGMVRMSEPLKPADELVLHKLQLYEWMVMVVHIHARSCSTCSKFRQRANFTKVLVSVNGTTLPLVVPFVRDHHAHHT